MMATAGPGGCSFLPLLEPLEDGGAGHAEQIDAYLTIAKYVGAAVTCDPAPLLLHAQLGSSPPSRLGGEEARHFLPAVEQHFPRLGRVTLVSVGVFGVLSQGQSRVLGERRCSLQAHVSSPHAELSQAALQALGFCVFHPGVVSGVSGT